jgi:hypothetical protein
VAVPANACVVNASANYRGAFVLVERGGCDFATKAKHMQRAGCATDFQYLSSISYEAADGLTSPAATSRNRATGIVVCDNGTGGSDPVDMNLGTAASELTLGIVAVNSETSDMLHSYVARPQRGETYQLYTEGCPYNMGQFTSQVRGSQCDLLHRHLAACVQEQSRCL